MATLTYLPETAAAPLSISRPDRRLRLAFWIFALLAAAVGAWVMRNTTSNDGISYLDMAAAVAQGDWSAAINGYWSPLYPLLLAAGLWIVKPAPMHEFALVHATNWLIFVGAFAGFDFFLRRIASSWVTRIAGYSVAIWALLELVTTAGVSPDMLVAAFVFWAMGLVAGIATGRARARSFVWLGVVLGLGYYAKAPLFPLAFVFLLLTLLAPGSWRQKLSGTLLAGFVFALVAAPLIALLSWQKQRLTFGDSGKLNYAWYVDGATYRHWQGEPLGGPAEVAPHWRKGPVSTGVPVHATRLILTAPRVFEFAASVRGTYPVWADPSYWNEGLRAPFDFTQQIRKILVNLKFAYSLLLNVHVVQLFHNGQWYRVFSPVLLATWLALAWKLRPDRRGLSRAHAALLLFAAAAFGMYLLVYCEPRHLAAFVAVLYTGLFAVLERDWIRQPLLARGAAAVLLASLLLTTGTSTLRLALAPPDRFEAWQVASDLARMGVHEGARVASLDYSNHRNAKWARLARARIVAELYEDAYAPLGAYWKLDEAAQARVLAAFRRAGATIVVDSSLPPQAQPPAGWERIGNTRYFLYRL
ncbi:MAG TPA: hypothetical protein VGK64_11080 [Bryobacteraceae bacterium]